MSFVLVPRDKTRSKLEPQPVPVPDEAALELEVQRRVRDELERLRQSTIAEAKTATETALRKASLPLEQQLQQALSALEEAAAQLTIPLARKEQYLADLSLDMAFQLARHIIGVTVTTDREPLLTLITDLLREAGTGRMPQQNLTVRLHPSDLSFIKEKLPETGFSFVADDSLSPGGALVELTQQDADPLDKTEWDARLENRLGIIQKAILPIGWATE